MSDRVLWTDREIFFETGIKRIVKVDIVLDIGCGIVPHNYITPYIYICCEPYNEYVEVLNKKIKNITDCIFVVLNYDWETVVKKFGEQSVDTVFLLDVIEHLDKKAGKRLLKKTEMIARKQIIIFTPLGFIEQKTLHGGKDAWGYNGAEWQEHKSGWFPEDFDESWEIVACKDFHLNNNIGEELDKPFGAFWAIKNINNSGDSFASLINKQSDLLPILFQQGKNVFQILKQDKAALGQDKATLEQKNTDLEQDKVTLEQKNTDLEQEKATLEQKNTNLEQDKAALEQDKAALEQDKAALEQDNAILKTQINDLNVHISNLHFVNEDLQNRNNVLQACANELNRIYNTRSWRLLNTVYKFKNKLFKNKY